MFGEAKHDRQTTRSSWILRCAPNDYKESAEAAKQTEVRESLVVLKILNRAFMLFRCCLAVERAEIFSFTRSRIFLARIQPVLPGFQFSNHRDSFGALQLRTPCACRVTRYSWRARDPRALNCRATAPVAGSRQAAERPSYKDFFNRFEKQSAISAARIVRLVAR